MTSIKNFSLIKYLLLPLSLLSLLTACPTDVPVPSVPNGLSAKAADKQVGLSWQANSEKNLKQYLILIESSGDLAETQTVAANTTSAVIKQLTNDKTYSFKIAAQNTDDKTSAYSVAALATPKAPTPNPGGGGGGAPKVAMPTGLKITVADASVTLNWNANTETNLKGYSVYWGTTPSALNQKQFVASGTTTLNINGLTNDTTYYFSVEAETTNAEKSGLTSIVAATPVAVVVQPSIEQVEIQDNGSSLQVRPGLDFVLNVKGQRLAGITKANLGDVTATISSPTDTTVKLSFSMPHGHALGLLDLSLTTNNGTALKAKTVEVTEIAVAKNPRFNPSDANLGTRERPFNTLSKALSVASRGDTVFLGIGTYSTDESWPVGAANYPYASPPNVRAGVSIVGQIKDQVILEGPGQGDGRGGSTALSFADDASLRNLTIKQFNRALVHVSVTDPQQPSGNIVLENVNVSESWDAFFSVNTSTVAIKGCNFSANSGSGVYVNVYNNVNIENTVLTGNTYGLYANGGIALNLSKVTAEKNIEDGFHLGEHYSANLVSVKSIGNQGNGMTVVIDENTGEFKLRSSELMNNNKDGIVFSGGSYSRASINLGSYAGTPQDLGNNTIINNDWQINDMRDADTGITILAEGNAIGGDGKIVPLGTYPTATSGRGLADGNVRFWRAEKPGNSISF